MRKYSTFLWSECSSYLLVKLGLLILLLSALVIQIDFQSAQTDYKRKQASIHANFTGEAIVEINYKQLREDVPLNPQRLVAAAEKELAVKAAYFNAQPFVLMDQTPLFPRPNAQALTVSEKNYYLPKALLLNNQLIEQLNLPLAEGNLALSANHTDRPPILLGSQYQKEFAIGDSFPLYWPVMTPEATELQLNPVTYQVSGFFSSDTQMLDYTARNGSTLALSEYVVIPLTKAQESSGNLLQVDLNHYFFLQKDLATSPFDLTEKLKTLGYDCGYQQLFLQNLQLQYQLSLDSLKSQVSESRFKMLLFGLFAALQIYVIVELLVKKRHRTYRIFYNLGSTKKMLFGGILLSYGILYLVMLLSLYLFNLYYLKNDWNFADILRGILLHASFFFLIISIASGRQLKKERMVV